MTDQDPGLTTPRGDALESIRGIADEVLPRAYDRITSLAARAASGEELAAAELGTLREYLQVIGEAALELVDSIGTIKKTPEEPVEHIEYRDATEPEQSTVLPPPPALTAVAAHPVAEVVMERAGSKRTRHRDRGSTGARRVTLRSELAQTEEEDKKPIAPEVSQLVDRALAQAREEGRTVVTIRYLLNLLTDADGHVKVRDLKHAAYNHPNLKGFDKAENFVVLPEGKRYTKRQLRSIQATYQRQFQVQARAFVDALALHPSFRGREVPGAVVQAATYANMGDVAASQMHDVLGMIALHPGVTPLENGGYYFKTEEEAPLPIPIDHEIVFTERSFGAQVNAARSLGRWHRQEALRRRKRFKVDRKGGK